MRTAEDDSVPVPHGALKLPRAVLNWKTPPPRVVVWRPQRDELEPEYTPVTRVDSLSASSSSSRASSDEFDDEPTRAIPTPLLPRAPERTDALQGLRGRFDVLIARSAAHLDAALARAAKLWRDRPLRTAAVVAGAALLTYLALGGVRRGSDNRTQTVPVPAAALPAAAPIIVEQLDGARQSGEAETAPLQGERSDKPGRRSASSRARVTSFATTPASKGNGYQVIARAQAEPRSSRVEPSSTTVSSGSAGLPAWGTEAVRDFSGGKSSVGASVTSHSQTLTAKPASSNTGIAPPMAASRSSAHEQPQVAPVVAAKPAEPVAPPRPSKPLTIDEVLNQVEEAAQAQRKRAGLEAPKASTRDAELDELINGAMKSKTK